MKRFTTASNLRMLAALVLIVATCPGGAYSTEPRETHSAIANMGAKAPELSAESQAWLLRTIESGDSTDLRWPDFNDYRKHLRKFYGFNGYSLWWIKGGKPTAQALQIIALLRSADRKGLSAEDYDGSLWDERLARLRPKTRQSVEIDQVKFDLDLTVCVMRYISDLHIGKVNPKHLAFALEEDARKYDLAEFIKDYVVSGVNLAGVLSRVEPQYPGYRRTIQALQTYLDLEKEDDGDQLPAIKKAILPGGVYSGIPRIARLLRLNGDLPRGVNISVNPPVYQNALVDAMKNFQRRHGRDPSGHIDAQTLADLNVPFSRRVRQMQLTLERWRWMPDSYQESPIVVNIGVTMKVVVGKAYGHHTPVFADTMEYVIFRPYWEVPYSITHAETIPHILRDPGYLAKENMEVVDGRQNVVSSGTVSSEVLDQLRARKLFVRQRPGPKNSLGLVKFVFPNSYNVYMHDTPSTELFLRSRRDFSHGCIRLERPADLAAWVLRGNPGWTLERIRAAMNGTVTQQVNLFHPIPVLILYGTVVVPEDGQVYFYDDIYGHDAALDKALANGYPYP